MGGAMKLWLSSLWIACALCLPTIGSAEMVRAVDSTNYVRSASDIIEAHRWQTNLILWVTGMSDARTTPYSIGDSSKNRFHFFQTNSARRPAWSNAAHGGYFTFTSPSALYDGDQLNSVFTTGQFSASAWITPANLTNNSATIIAKYSDSGVAATDISRMFLFGLNTNRLRLVIANTNGTFFAIWVSSAAITANVPAQVGFTFDQSAGGTNRGKLFVNGQIIPTYTPNTDTGAVVQSGAAKISIGGVVNAGGAQGYYFPGQIDDVRVFNTPNAAVQGESYTNGRAKR